jgi:tRNA-2-methylthio-N6-dimethylallyladenosine synthase
MPANADFFPLPTQASQPLSGLRVRLVTFGCQMNKYDSSLIADLLAANGALITDEADCDWLLFNTCAVRGHAEERLASRLGAFEKKIKHRRPRIGVMGCVAQIEAERLIKRFPFISFFSGTRMFDRVPDLISAVERGSPTPLAATQESVSISEKIAPLRPRRGSAFLTVSRGCNKRCAYCVVPSTRGPEASRSPEVVEAEVHRLIEAGVEEITLLGQTIDTYGRDLDPSSSLADLLRRLHSAPGLRRLRFLTNHPAECTEDLFRVMADFGEKIMPFIHMPPQSARRLCPEIEFGGDWIVGFCGETHDDFQASLSLLREVGFQQSYVFGYSPRRTSSAAELPDDVPTAIKRERHQALLALQESISLQKNLQLIGKTEEVLVEGPSKTDPRRLTGRTRTNRLLHFHDLPDSASLGSAGLKSIVRVRVLDASPLCLLGERIV